MFDKRLEINHQIHNLVADTFNNLVEKYDVGTDDRSNLHKVLAEVDRLVEYKDSMNLADQPAPVKPSSYEIIKALLDSGKKAVPCWVSDLKDVPTAESRWVLIKEVIVGKYPYVNVDGAEWKFATPFDLDSEEAITELPE